MLTVALTTGLAHAGPAEDESGWQTLLSKWSSAETVQATVTLINTGPALRGDGGGGYIQHLYLSRKPLEIVLLRGGSTRTAGGFRWGDGEVAMWSTGRAPEGRGVFDLSGVEVVLQLVHERLAPCSVSVADADGIPLPLPLESRGRYHWRRVQCPGTSRAVYVAYGYAPADTTYSDPLLDQIAFMGERGPVMIDIVGTELNGARPAWLAADRFDAAGWPPGGLFMAQDAMASDAMNAWRSTLAACLRGECTELGPRPDLNAEPDFFRPVGE
jgi:hypothetical protein